MQNEDLNDETFQIIYEEVLDQFKGNFRSYQTLRERLGQIIAFIGVILNIELLGILQIITTQLNVTYMEILVLSSGFIVISLIVAVYAYTSAPLKTIKSTDYFHKFYKEEYLSKLDLLQEICKERENNMRDNKSILLKRAIYTHVSLYTLVLGIFLVAVFIVINITNIFYIVIFAILAVIITYFIYRLVKNDLKKKLLKNPKEKFKEDIEIVMKNKL